ncbi:unnamed protein product [Closterium sp. Yama58-4]|nr:unnamed protein product [Closterium sp. Yama58-4]
MDFGGLLRLSWQQRPVWGDSRRSQHNPPLPPLLSVPHLPPTPFHCCHHSELASSGLSGAIPGDLSTITNLKHLDMSNNSLNGSIPDAVSNLQALTLPPNTSPRLISSPIPPSPAACASDMHNNSLNGSIPDTISNLQSLTDL